MRSIYLNICVTEESAEATYFPMKSNIGMMMHWRGGPNL